MIRVFRRLFEVIILLALAGPAVSGQTESEIKNVFWQPNELQPGSVAFFTVELKRGATKVSGEFLGKKLLFTYSAAMGVWFSLAGVDVETTPDTYDLKISAALPSGRVTRIVKPVEIGTITFGTGDVNVPENFVKPDQASQEKIAADERIKKRAFAHFIPTVQWSGDFVRPVESQPTNSFGMLHIFNEELSSEHRGTDFPVKEGSPVLASNSGTVVLARELFYEGNCVVLDHGQHFFTIYMHLSKIYVREGQRARKMQRLGLSGATGRVTGPHLHMGVRWEGAYLDPTKLLGLTLPKTTKVVRTAGTPNARRRR
jgi:murein DD-endopeptidase MepM/ murein hydrolase activator NlpD